MTHPPMIDVTPTKAFVVARNDASKEESLRRAVVAIGNFDGVHRGHRAVIAAALARAHSARRPAVALTFEPHPRRYFRPDEPLFRLTPEPAKLRLLATTGLDGAIVLRFDAALASLTAAEFVSRILVQRLAIAGAAIGFNFRFGRDRAGTPDDLVALAARHGFAVDVVPPLHEGGLPVSSEPIRAALRAGRVTEAAELLGYPWFVTGTVIPGDRRGRALGYPTANLALDPDCGLRHGIYAVRAGVDDRIYGGVANFGRRPTFDNGAVLLEVFLFDFAGDLYGKTLDVAFIDRIRDELRFDSVPELVRAMDADSARARAVLARAGGRFPPLASPALLAADR